LYGLIYGILIGIGFIMSPVVLALGIGHLGVDFGVGFPITVILAHVAFGLLLGWIISLKNNSDSDIINSFK